MKSEDLISRETAYEVLSEYYHHRTVAQHKALREALDRVPSATQTNAPNVLNALDCVSRQAVLEAIDTIESEVADGDGFQYDKWRQFFCDLPTADIDLSDYSDRLWRKAYEQGKADAEPRLNNHEVACIIADLMGDACACNVNGIDEWLPRFCEFANNECPHPAGVACWEQYLKWKGENDV